MPHPLIRITAAAITAAVITAAAITSRITAIITVTVMVTIAVATVMGTGDTDTPIVVMGTEDTEGIAAAWRTTAAGRDTGGKLRLAREQSRLAGTSARSASGAGFFSAWNCRGDFGMQVPEAVSASEF